MMFEGTQTLRYIYIPYSGLYTKDSFNLSGALRDPLQMTKT